jgi:phage terminase small subunit
MLRFKAKTADRIGPQLLGKTWVAARIQELKDERAERSGKTGITAEKVIMDIEAIKADAMQKLPDHEGNLVMVNHSAALRAAELQGKHLGIFIEKRQVEHGGKLTLEELISEAND